MVSQLELSLVARDPRLTAFLVLRSLFFYAAFVSAAHAPVEPEGGAGVSAQLGGHENGLTNHYEGRKTQVFFNHQ